MIQGKTAADKAAFIASVGAKTKWKSSVKTADDATMITLTRGKETVEIRYDGNSCVEMPTVTYDGQVRQVRNVAAAMRVLESSAKENAAVFVDRAEKKAAMRRAAPVRRAPGERAQRIAVTLDGEEDDIKAKLIGKKLVWTNRISGELEQDVVTQSRNSNGHFYVRNGQVSFVGNYGFRSVRLDQLVAVR